MRQFRVLLTGSHQDGWTVEVPGAGRVTVESTSRADFEARRLIEHGLGLPWSEVDDLDIALMDEAGARHYVFDLLFTRDEPDDPAVRACAADPPAGCRYHDFGGHPGLRCVRPGANRFDAVAVLVAEVRDRHGLHADDLGFEKLWEWAGSRDWREQMIGHLLLMVAERARWTGVPAADLVGFLRTVLGETRAGSGEHGSGRMGG